MISQKGEFVRRLAAEAFRCFFRDAALALPAEIEEA